METLGRSDDLPHEDDDAGECDEASIVGEQFVISCSDAAEVFELVDELDL